MRSRVFAGVIAASAWAAELIFYIGNVRASGAPLGAMWDLLGYLTDWSNLIVALVCTAVAVGSRRFSSPRWRLMATTAIVLMGTAFALIGGWSVVWSQGVGSVLAHVVNPVLMLVFWLLTPHGALRWANAVLLPVFPAAYFAWMFARGLTGGDWPYPQVDVGEVGWGSALTFCGMILGLYLAIGGTLILIDQWLGHVRMRRSR